MNDKQYMIGEDFDRITSVSIDALYKLFSENMVLEKIEIGPDGDGGIMCSFIFKDDGVYNASGFCIGYGGEGPNGLYTAIRMFCPGEIEKDFLDTPISKLDSGKAWNWFPKKGFVSAE